MRNLPDRRAEQGSHVEPRSITPDSIIAYLDKKIDSVRVSFADKYLITIPDNWHGAGKQGEALVKVGDMLTEPMAGTELPAKAFVHWMLTKGFTISSPSEAIQLMESNAEGLPLLRFTRKDSGKTPIEIQIYRGGACKELQTLTRIGNKNVRDLIDDDRVKYIDSVRTLFSPFISKGTRDARLRLGLSGPVDILRRVDDCFASGVTIIGDQIIDDRMQTPKERLVEVIDVSVATTQAMVLAIAMAEYRKVPLIMRVGAPAFGLGNGEHLNYMVNTLPKMKRYGQFAVGDMGKLMDTGSFATAEPYMHTVREHEEVRELRLFLGGGGPILGILKKELESHGKPMGWDVSVRRASRVDHGPKEWAVLMSGSNLIVRPARKDSVFLPPDREVWLNQYGKFKQVENPGLWVSLGNVNKELGLQEAFYYDRGMKRKIYILLHG